MAKPSTTPEWTLTNPAVRAEPTVGKKETGFFANERIAYQYLNWILFNITEWIKYFDSEIDSSLAGFSKHFDWLVGSEGTNEGNHYDSLYTLLQAGVVNAGDNILVYSSETMDDTVQIGLNSIQIHFHPRVVMTKGAATLGLQILAGADRVKISGGRFSGFTGVGVKAIQVDSGADYCRFADQNFTNCDVSIEDNGSGNSIQGIIEE